MKKIFSIILCAAVVLVSGCSTGSRNTQEDGWSSYYESVRSSEEKSSSIAESIAAEEAEIEDVDEWGISIDDVDRLAKQSIRKHENINDYRQYYSKAIRETDDFLEDLEDGKEPEISFAEFLDKYKTACEKGIDYIESTVDVEFFYNMYNQYGGFDKSEKDLIRSFLTVWNGFIEEIEKSITDMESLLNPIIEEDRNLTDEEFEKVLDIYQVLVDKVDTASNPH